MTKLSSLNLGSILKFPEARECHLDFGNIIEEFRK